MKVKLQRLAEIANAEIVGDPDFEVHGLAPLEEATDRDLSFVADAKYLERAKERGVGAVFISDHEPSLDAHQLVVSDPRLAFFTVASVFVEEREQTSLGVSSLAFVHETAALAPGVSVGPFAHVGPGAEVGEGTRVYPFVYIGPRAKIGRDCVLFSHVSVGSECVIGDRVRLHFGVSIGADGFGYVELDGRQRKIPQVGAVVIEDDVEIGANSCVDRATIGNTVIGAGTKIDNLVQVGHNCKVGKNCILVAHAGLGGSTVLGDNVVVAARAGTKDHIKVGERSMIGGMAGVGYDLSPDSKVIGYPAEDHLSWKRKLVYLSKLGDLFSRVKSLEEKVKRLEGVEGEGDR